MEAEIRFLYIREMAISKKNKVSIHDLTKNTLLGLFDYLYDTKTYRDILMRKFFSRLDMKVIKTYTV